MGTVTNFLLCSFIVGIAQNEVVFKSDRPFKRVPVFHTAELECCYTSESALKLTWIKQDVNKTLVPLTVEYGRGRIEQGNRSSSGNWYGTLTIEPVLLNDSGLYQCWLNGTEILSHGTYLQVYMPMEKTINLSESTKNKILTAEGILLLLCVLVPSITLLFKSQRLNELEKKKAKKEEENIYQGLNVDECWSTYDQIERSQARGPYQDVGNMKEEEQIQLEKP